MIGVSYGINDWCGHLFININNKFDLKSSAFLTDTDKLFIERIKMINLSGKRITSSVASGRMNMLFTSSSLCRHLCILMVIMFRKGCFIDGD